MYLLQPHLHTRRAFLRRAGQLALTGTALPMALNLAALGEAAAFNVNPSDPNDYKALVCACHRPRGEDLPPAGQA